MKKVTIYGKRNGLKIKSVGSNGFLRCSTVLLLLIIVGCKEKSKTALNQKDEVIEVLRQPAEYDEQEAVWLLWSPVDHLKGQSNVNVTLKIIDALVQKERIIVSAATDSLLKMAQKSIPKEYLDKGWVELLKIPSEELWVRDMGPNFVVLTNGKKAIVDFGFNAWGYTDSDNMDDYTIRMEKFDEAVAHIKNLPLIQTNLISEGGNREVNGEGVLMVTEAVERGRNPNMDLKEMEAEFQRVLGIEKVIWLKEGLKEDDHTFRGVVALENGEFAYTAVTTNGHIDEFARFVNDSTILLASVKAKDLEDPVAAENHKRMEENYNILTKATDQNGNPFNIIRMPLPKLVLGKMGPGDLVYDFISELEYEDGSVFPVGDEVTVIAAASYLNFLITDEVVIGQKYYSDGMDKEIEERDKEAKNILQQVFPNRTIVMINALAVNFGGGGIHCITMNEPTIDNRK
ncbi:Agmatine deiminase [Flagellimonas maritima]|uniref:Agmatine deiminase n=1 Tax=Flagellimonas maritima TaxID=1383885 RepID=A0A2Z4LW45_9FLAO|nr:agmatine deiminase family protein [Allomuricauda aurantiaca]AWX45557.1 Agmatine deiminase [Allomuricauda aurantiaca]